MIILKRILTGGKENIIDKIIITIIRLLEPVIFLSFLSIETYGYWLILITIPYYLSISELGFGDVITNEINMLKEKKKLKYSKYLFQNLLKFIIYTTLFFLIIFFLIFFYFNFFDLNHISIQNLEEIIFVLLIYTLVSQIHGIFIKFLSINNYFNLSVKLSYINKIFEFILISITLFLSNNLLSISLSILFTKVIFLLVVIYYVRKNIKWFEIGNFKKFKFSIKKNFFKKYIIKSMLYSSAPIGHILRLQVTTLIIGITLGPAILVLINIYLTVARFPIQIANIADAIIRIELAKLYMKDKLIIFKKYFSTNLILVFTIGIIYLILIYFTGEHLIYLWLDGKIEYYNFVFLFFILYGFINTITISVSSPLFSTNNFKQITIIFLLINIFAILSLKLFSKDFGVLFVALNFLFFEILYFFSCFYYSKKKFQLRFEDYKPDLLFIKKILKILFKTQ